MFYDITFFKYSNKFFVAQTDRKTVAEIIIFRVTSIPGNGDHLLTKGKADGGGRKVRLGQGPMLRNCLRP